MKKMKGKIGILVLGALVLSLVVVPSGGSTNTEIDWRHFGACTIGFESGAWNESCGDASVSKNIVGSDWYSRPAGNVIVVKAADPLAWPNFLPEAKEGERVLKIYVGAYTCYGRTEYSITTGAREINFWYSSGSSCNDCGAAWRRGNMYFYVDGELQPSWGGKVFCGQPCDGGCWTCAGPGDWAPWQEYSVTDLPEGQHTFKWIVEDSGCWTGSELILDKIELKGYLMIEDLNLPQGTETSLISMVNNAQKAFDKGNEKAAVNILEAFINYVQAQSGKKISVEDAEMLIEYAQNVIAQTKGG